MSARWKFQTQILEKVAAPLMTAIADVATRKREGEDIIVREDAEHLAILLNKSVYMAIALAKSMDLTAHTESADAGRLALAGVVTPVVASFYRRTGRVPSDTDVKRMTKAMEAALTFADSFAPVGENTARLENIRAGDILMDEDQLSIRYVNIMGPVVNAVAAFSFGRQDTKLVQEIGDILVARAVQIAGEGKENKVFALGVLEALVDIYVECHRADKIRLTTMDEMERARMAEEGGGTMPMDGVWRLFEIRAAMIEIVAGKREAIKEGTAANADAGLETAVPAQPAAPQRQDAARSKRSKKSAPVYTGAGSEVSPMSMFASGDSPEVQHADSTHYSDEDGEGPEYDDDGGDEEGDEGGYNPMSFFSQ